MITLYRACHHTPLIDRERTPQIMNLGVAYGQKRLIENALTSFESATRLDPDDATYHNNAAKTYEIKNSARLYY